MVFLPSIRTSSCIDLLVIVPHNCAALTCICVHCRETYSIPLDKQHYIVGKYAVFMHPVPSYVLFSAGLDNLTLLNGTAINVTEDMDVVIEIGFNANPMPTFNVTHISTVSADQPNSRFNISGNILRLGILNVEVGNTGIYTVEGRNLTGMVSADFNLTVSCESIPIAAIACILLCNFIQHVCMLTHSISGKHRSATFLVSCQRAWCSARHYII